MLDEFQSEIESIRLVPSIGGIFEVSVDDELIFSKKTLESPSGSHVRWQK